uniref:AlNc14C139G7208 protein n=1 Tax=Albugo laibachii Nc14 TaxID=890382 RepID=F0WL19_9STRA|nr:AlNc14C139G7208 [Albugo laibachii Nc14]|eukprot:CCA21978.1 AlNc14C139G7208 [Albugo laibachii Nc14]
MMQVSSSWCPESLDQMPVEACDSPSVSRFSLTDAFHLTDAEVKQVVTPFLQLNAVDKADTDEHRACEIYFDWNEREYTCNEMHFQFTATARHVEIYASGSKSTPWGDQEGCEAYIQTLRGSKSSSTDSFDYFFFEIDITKNYNYAHLSSCKLKCVSLTGNQAELKLSGLKLKLQILPKVQQKLQLAVNSAQLNGTMERLSVADMATQQHLSHEAIVKLDLMQKSLTEQMFCRLEQSMERVMDRLKIAEDRLDQLGEQVREHGVTAKAVEKLRKQHSVIVAQMADVLERNRA